MTLSLLQLIVNWQVFTINICRFITFLLLFSRASRTLRVATQVFMFLSVRNKINFFAQLTPPYLQVGLTDLDEIWHDGRS